MKSGIRKNPYPRRNAQWGSVPVNYEGNRRNMFSYDALIMEKADHFLIMDPEEFNAFLKKRRQGRKTLPFTSKNFSQPTHRLPWQ
jgi:hypothetical protein